MCKLVMFGGVRPKYRENAERFIKVIAPIMSENDKDGLGYAAIDPDGNLSGERWHNNKEAFKNRNKIEELDNLIMTEYRNTLYKDEKYNSFGDTKKPIAACILHARMATSGKVFANTHPFVEGHTALIHNGVIHNDNMLKVHHTMKSTCDSEVILHEYLKEDVVKDIKSFEKVAKTLTGYFALGILSKLSDGTPILDVVKDDRASLYAAHVLELGTIVFATDPSHIFKACKNKKLNFTISSYFQVKENSIIRINALTGHVIDTATFDKSTTTQWSSQWESRYGREHEYIDAVMSHKADVISLPKTHEFSPLNTKELESIVDWEYTEETKTWKKVGK